MTYKKMDRGSEATDLKKDSIENDEVADINELVEDDWGIIIGQSDLKRCEQIGIGSMAVVYKGRWQGKLVAIKAISSANKATYRRQLSYAREVHIMTTVSHDNLVAFHGIAHSPKSIDIVLEYCAGGDCFELVHNQQDVELSWGQVRKLCYDVAVGMSYLHNFNPQIIHRDLKSLNVLLRNPVSEGTIPWAKISDFGLSKMKEVSSEGWASKMTLGVGTEAWMAPEVHLESYDEKIDVYSYAMFMYEVICSEIPFEECPSPKVCMDGIRPDLSAVPDTCPVGLLELMQDCWEHTPMLRPSFHQIVALLVVSDNNLSVSVP